MKQILGPIISDAEVMPRVHLLWLEAPEIAAEAQPGQFVTLRCGEGFEYLLRRPFSIHRMEAGKLALVFRVVGKGTEWLSHRREGELLDLIGPLGNGFEVHQSSQNLLLIAGGIGIAPLVALAESALAGSYRVKLLLGAETSSQLYPENLIPKGLEFIPITEDGSAGEKGLITDLLPSVLGWADQAFACGPIPMYRAIAAMGIDLDNKSIQVLLEQVMGCGVGACHGCAIPTNQGMKLVCQDGPVFELREIIWGEIKEPGMGKVGPIKSA
jgi:dihydroorotate dehydrogenase electron transfer subunit